jgi:hypothetical protein
MISLFESLGVWGAQDRNDGFSSDWPCVNKHAGEDVLVRSILYLQDKV